MKKIPTLFIRDPKDRAHVTRDINPGCEWVTAGEGVATIKWDGTCTLLDEAGDWWARREVKPGKKAPDGFREEQHDEVTGKRVGWEPMANSPFRKFHTEALAMTGPTLIAAGPMTPGTYELVGPKIQGNPDGFATHLLIRHGWAALSAREATKNAPRDYDGLSKWFRTRLYEGLVWHHPDGRMVKIKQRDFPSVD
jgi:hypothetical protein